MHSILSILLNKENCNLERPSIELVKSVKVHRRGAKVVAWEIEEVGGPLPWARTKLELQKFVMTHGVCLLFRTNNGALTSFDVHVHVHVNSNRYDGALTCVNYISAIVNAAKS